MAFCAIAVLVSGLTYIETASAEDLHAELPSKAKSQEVCEFVASINKWEVEDYFLKRGYIDVNNDGEPEYIEQGHSGTMGGDRFKFKTTGGEELRLTQIGFEWKDYWTHGQAVLPFGNRVYLVHFNEEDLNYPRYLSYISPANKERVICEFSNSVTTRVGYPSEDTKLCRKLLVNPPESIHFGETHNLKYPAFDRSETRPLNSGHVDFDNDTNIDNLVELSYESGAGRGYSFNYFDLLTDNKTNADNTADQSLLMELQVVDLSKRIPGRPGSNDANWFVVDGVTYLENKHGTDQPTNKRSEFHTIKYLKNRTVHTACTYAFWVQTKAMMYKL